MTTKDCPACKLVAEDSRSNIILENKHAIALALDEHREGHCLVWLKRHVTTISDMEPDEYNQLFDVITRLSKALEKKYNAEKTYLLAIGDGVPHIHFHLIPKHEGLPSMGAYCFGKLWEAEPREKPTEEQQKALADEIRELIKV